MRRLLPSAAACLALLVAAPTSSATIYGVESNSELVNSSVTRASQARTLDRMRLQGVRIVRVNMGWNEIARDSCRTRPVYLLRRHDNGCYDWRVFDGVVQEAQARRITVLASVSRAPRWLHGSSNPSYLGRTGAQWRRSALHYSAFMEAAAKRYSGIGHGYVRRWTVWNEPNSKTYFAPINTRAERIAAPKRYAQMYGMTAVAMRRASPHAVLAVGPTGPRGTIAPLNYIREVQAALPRFLPGTIASKRSYIGAWAHNPYPGVSRAPSRGIVKLPWIGMANVSDLFRQLDRSPLTRGKQVWATEFAYQTNPPDRTLGISPHLQGRYIAESFDWLDSKRRIPVLIWYGFTDGDRLIDWQGGTYFANGRPKVSLLWWRRPISVPVSSTRRGGMVRVWSRSNVNPYRGRIAMSTNGRTWRLLSMRGRRGDGTTVQTMRLFRTTWFATWDGVRGPARVVRVR